MEEKNDNEETFNIKLNLYDELIDLKVNSDYNYFVKNICTILNISPEQLKSFSLSYNDEDGDSILLSTEEDYTIFFQQVKEKTVNSLNTCNRKCINIFIYCVNRVCIAYYTR